MTLVRVYTLQWRDTMKRHPVDVCTRLEIICNEDDSEEREKVGRRRAGTLRTARLANGANVHGKLPRISTCHAN